jgi:hypothetical protein
MAGVGDRRLPRGFARHWRHAEPAQHADMSVTSTTSFKTGVAGVFMCRTLSCATLA